MNEERDPKVTNTERQQTHDLLVAAADAAREGALVAERLRIATEQYRARLNPKKGSTR